MEEKRTGQAIDEFKLLSFVEVFQIRQFLSLKGEKYKESVKMPDNLFLVGDERKVNCRRN